jgi:hypothetical protein
MRQIEHLISPGEKPILTAGVVHGARDLCPLDLRMVTSLTLGRIHSWAFVSRENQTILIDRTRLFVIRNDMT